MERMDGIRRRRISGLRALSMFSDAAFSQGRDLFLNHLIDRFLIRINELPPLNEIPPGQALFDVAIVVTRMGHLLKEGDCLLPCFGS